MSSAGDSGNIQGFPQLDVPIAGPGGILARPWYRFFISLWNRSGGSNSSNPNAAYLQLEGPNDGPPVGVFRASDGEKIGDIPVSLPKAEIFIGSSGNDPLPQPVSGDAELAENGVLTVTGSQGHDFGPLAFSTDAGFLTGSLDLSIIPLPDAHILVGNGGSASAVALSGDATISNTGDLELVATGVTPGTYGDPSNYPVVTVDAKGRITAASTEPAGGASGANPTATASDTPVNGVAATFIRSDGAPAVQKATTSQYGLVKPDGVTTNIVGGLLVASGSVSNTTYQHAGTNSTSAAHSFASQGNIYTPFQNMSVLSVSVLMTTVTSGVYKIGIAPWDGVSKITGAPTYSNSVTAGTGAANAVQFFTFSSPVSLTKGTPYIVFIVRTDATSSTSMTLNFGLTASSQSPALFSSPSAANQFFEVASLAPTTSDTWSTPGTGVCTQIIVYTIP